MSDYSDLCCELAAVRDECLRLTAELESARKQIQELAKQCGRFGARVAMAERKLATPVRLPEKDDLKLAGDESTKVVIKFRNSAIDECAEAIRAAGFTVEGDE